MDIEIQGQRADPGLRRLIASALPGARIVRVEALGADAGASTLSTAGGGYGAPLRIEVEVGGERRSVTLRTVTSNVFGQDRRADHAAAAMLAADTFGSIPRHVRALDAGAYGADGDFISLRSAGEFYVLSEWASGEPYAERLRRIARRGALMEDDTRMVGRLASYLAELHAERLTLPFARERALRELFGSGTGIFGIVDAYPPGAGGVSPARLRLIEERAHAWRWKLKHIERPLVRTHGDFHPNHVLFDASGELRMLATTRGSAGEAADDVTCMAMSFPFLALEEPRSWRGALSGLWYELWGRYLEWSRDAGLLDVAAPFLAFRGLTLASPVRYPALGDDSRARLLDFVETALAAERFSANLVERMFQ